MLKGFRNFLMRGDVIVRRDVMVMRVEGSDVGTEADREVRRERFDGHRAHGHELAKGADPGRMLAEIQSWPERVAAVTADDVLRMATKVLQHKEGSVTGLLLPDRPEAAAAAPLARQQPLPSAVE